MSIHWVPGVLRAAGLTVVEHDGWQNRSNGSLAADYWVWHHDASARGDSPGVPAYMIRNFRNAGAQLWVDRQGRWHIIAAGRAAHAGKVLPGKPGNSNSIGIETDHTTGEDWPPALLNSLRRGTAAMMRYRGKNENHLEFHKTICSPPGRKVDPDGMDLAYERGQIRVLLNQSTAVAGNNSTQNPLEGFLMALTDIQQQQMYDALVGPNGSPALVSLMPFGQNLATSVATVREVIQVLDERTRDIEWSDGSVVPLRQEIANIKAIDVDIQAALTNALPVLLSAKGAIIEAVTAAIPEADVAVVTKAVEDALAKGVSVDVTVGGSK